MLNKLFSLFGRSATPPARQAPPPAGPATVPTPGGRNERRKRPRINPRQGTRVMVVDDSPTIVKALGRMLQSVGCVVIEAGDAETALELAEQRPPDLIFLDIVLPGMDGFAALRRLRRNPATSAIPVIIISGNAQATEHFFGSRIAADDFMKKPFSRFEVFSRIERLLDDEFVPRRTVTSMIDDDQGATLTA
ncbi:MAG: response regulator [Rhodocyclaceae bacterium]|nr:response regulator [Rhodocyclaceae bacterium]